MEKRYLDAQKENAFDAPLIDVGRLLSDKTEMES
jgi:hypothetical protein